MLFQPYTVVSKKCTLQWYVLKSMSWKKRNKFVNGGGSNVQRWWQNVWGDYFYRLKCDNLSEPDLQAVVGASPIDSLKTALEAELTSVLGILDNWNHVPPRNDLFQHLYSHPSLSWQWTWRILECSACLRFFLMNFYCILCRPVTVSKCWGSRREGKCKEDIFLSEVLCNLDSQPNFTVMNPRMRFEGCIRMGEIRRA
jgi:hypothetical protein